MEARVLRILDQLVHALQALIQLEVLLLQVLGHLEVNNIVR